MLAAASRAFVRRGQHINQRENADRKLRVVAAVRLLNTAELRAAAVNLEAVTDVTPGMLEALHRHEVEGIYRGDTTHWSGFIQRYTFGEHVAAQRRAVLEWAHVRRGSDLFVRGLGRFDIGRAACKFQWDWIPQLERDWNAWNTTWVLRPQDLQARGHYPAMQDEASYSRIASVLTLPEDHPVRCHLVRFHSHWARPENENTLHELVEAAKALSRLERVRLIGPARQRMLMRAGVTNMSALATLDEDRQARIVSNSRGLSKRMLQTLVQNAAEELQRCWPDIAADARPITLLRQLRELERTRQNGPDVHFAHLDSLADGPIYKDGLQIQVLRSTRAIVETARRLRNCAASYAKRVKAERYVLMSLVDTKTGKPKALGGFDIHLWLRYSSLALGECGLTLDLITIVEHSNSAPSRATTDPFETYWQSHLQDWWILDRFSRFPH